MDNLNKSFICCISPYLSNEAISFLVTELQKEFSKVEYILDNTEWVAPVSYINEMNGELKTLIFVLKKPLNLKQFVNLKQYCMFIEEFTKIGDSRQFNLNPGYLSYEGMFLATHKPSIDRNREYLMNNIWQEKQFEWEDKIFKANRNTFDEYRDNQRITFLSALNKIQLLPSCQNRIHHIISPAANKGSKTSGQVVPF